MRSVWLVLGSVLTVGALVAATVIVWMAVALARNPMEVARRSIAFSGAALNVKTTSAGVNLFITRGDAGQIVLERRSLWSAAKPVVTEGWDGVNLVLDVACPGMDSSGEGFCESDYTLSLPPETALTATAFQGSLGVHGIYGALRLTTTSGQIGVSGTPASLWARTDTGSVSGHEFCSENTDVEVGTGHVQLDFAKPPQQVRAVVRASGDVNLHLSDRGPYDLVTQGDQVRVRVDKNSQSARKITAITHEGEVTIDR